MTRCSDMPLQTWNTGPLLSDSCGYIALSHPPAPPRVIVAFRGTYSIANTLVDLSTIPQEYVPYPGDDEHDEALDAALSSSNLPDDVPLNASDKCDNCTAHSGFYTSWLNTRSFVISEVKKSLQMYPGYRVTVVGHSLGGAVAAFAALNFQLRGWKPQVTTFGEPRIGNRALVNYLDHKLGLDQSQSDARDGSSFRRVTHVGDPIPLLPLEEWGYRMHAGEIYISKSELHPNVTDLEHCEGDADPVCIQRDQSEVLRALGNIKERFGHEKQVVMGPLQAVERESADPEWIDDDGGMWTVPPRFRLWQLFFAHRDYFWRLGVCVPGGDPKNWKRSKAAPNQGLT
jgi:pimeloyl-ACP methyl ester carboxylesterase